MTANQIYQLVNAVTQEALGASALTVKDTSSFISLGKEVLKTDTTKDAFYNKLADRIGRVYIKYRRYVTDARKGLFMQPLDFGIALQKIQVKKVGSAENNQSWGNQTSPFSQDKDPTDIEQKIFSKMGTWQVETKIIYDVQLNSAFKDEASFGSFVNMIFNDMYNAMELQLQNLANLARATAIAQCLKSNKATVKRNLLDEYKTNVDATSTLTAADCLYDVDFLKYATKEINLVTKRIQQMSELFVPAGAYDRFVPESEIMIDILSEFETSAASYLQADTFHKELVALPNGMNTVNFWQSPGTDYSLENTSTININDADGDTTEQSGVICFVHDREAIGVMIDRIRTKSQYNAICEMNNYSHKADWGMFTDPTEVAVVFYVAD